MIDALRKRSAELKEIDQKLTRNYSEIPLPK